jgi:hypothetical protein
MRMRLGLVALLRLVPLALKADCPIIVNCDIDGEGMMEEESYVNGIHVSQKFGHTHYGSHGPEHHYKIIQCQ